MLLLDGAYESEEKFVLRYAEGDDAGEVYKVFEYGKVVELCGHYSIVRRMELFSGGEVLSLKSISREYQSLTTEEMLSLTSNKGAMPLMPGRAYWPTTKRDWKRSSNPKRVPMTPSLAEKLPEGKWLVPCTPERVPIVLMPHDGVLLVDGIKNSVTAILPVWRDNGDDKALLEACQRYADYLVKHSSRGNLLSKVCLCPIENKTSLPTGGKYFINGLFPTHEQEMLAAAHVIKMRLTNIVRINLRHGLGLGGVDLERMIRVYCS